jgi:pilus assembly protein Flp/PilA
MRHRANLERSCCVARGPEGIMMRMFQAFWSDESGQGLVEYALIIALVAVGLIAILLVLRNSIGDVFNNASEALQNAPTNPYP